MLLDILISSAISIDDEDKQESFKELKSRFEKEHPQSKTEIKQHQELMSRIRGRVERKKYNKMLGKGEGWDDSEASKGVQQYHTSLAFGTSFITLMFLGFALGFYLGKFFFLLEEIQ